LLGDLENLNYSGEDAVKGSVLPLKYVLLVMRQFDSYNFRSKLYSSIRWWSSSLRSNPRWMLTSIC